MGPSSPTWALALQKENDNDDTKEKVNLVRFYCDENGARNLQTPFSGALGQRASKEGCCRAVRNTKVTATHRIEAATKVFRKGNDRLHRPDSVVFILPTLEKR